MDKNAQVQEGGAMRDQPLIAMGRGAQLVIEVLLVFTLVTVPPMLGAEEVFHIGALPSGADVTINRPATTNIPLGTRVRLSATDSPQSISFTVVAPHGKSPQPIKVAIFDSQQDKVRYVAVTPKNVALYTFKGLSSIVILPQTDLPQSASTKDQVMLQIASDKPLTMAH